jgi:hypothetical protein
MRVIRQVLVIAASLFVAACRDEAGPTAPSPSTVPLIAGTWNGTVSVLSDGDGLRCPVTVEIEQPSAGKEVSGSIHADCFFALFEARLVEGSRWRIAGGAHYSVIDDTFSAVLNGSLEGAPVSRISATTDRFKNHERGERAGIRLELTRSAPGETVVAFRRFR